MRLRTATLALLGIFALLLFLHARLLQLPFFWDEAGYYIPAALDFYRQGLLIPVSTLPTGHTPLVPIYLGIAWRLFGFSALVTRSAMILLASATLLALFALGRRVTRGEVAAWAALLLGLSPLFFAQSSLAQLDLPVALFTTLAVLQLLDRRWRGFALSASMAVLTKETAVILLPVAGLYAWRERKSLRWPAWMWVAAPLAPLLLWTAYYHQRTGFWTGNGPYLAYNLYSTLKPAHIFAGLLRRLYEVFIGGFNWLLWLGAIAGILWQHRHARAATPVSPPASEAAIFATERQISSPSAHPARLRKDGAERGFFFLTAALTIVFVLFHSAVGGAVLPRYLLPIFPLLYLALVMLIDRLPRLAARGTWAVMAILFVAAWFINPPYPFPYEDNLAYADFVRLHKEAARFLAQEPGRPRILTAWPATDELTRPFLGYVDKPLRVIRLKGFSARAFKHVSANSFDILYIYSRQWNPPGNWLTHWPMLRLALEHLFEYAPPISGTELFAAYPLKPLAVFRERGQWVRLYSENNEALRAPPAGSLAR
jgi:4-amino-4-deoxy-L-arabinose transferase-like glycosyltransferase